MKNIFATKHYCIEHHTTKLVTIRNDCANAECEKTFMYCLDCGLREGEHL